MDFPILDIENSSSKILIDKLIRNSTGCAVDCRKLERENQIHKKPVHKEYIDIIYSISGREFDGIDEYETISKEENTTFIFKGDIF